MRTLPKWTSRKRRAFCLTGSYLIILWTLLMPMTSIMHVPFFSTCPQVFIEPCQILFCYLSESSYVHVVLQVMCFHLLGDGIETCTADELLIGLVITAGYTQHGINNGARETLLQQILRGDGSILNGIVEQCHDLLLFRCASFCHTDGMEDVNGSRLVNLSFVCLGRYFQGTLQ